MSERTEAPSGKRLGEARARGQIARSIELNTAAALLVGFWLLNGPGVELARGLETTLRAALIDLPTEAVTGADVRELIVEMGARLLPPLAYVVIGLLVTGVVVTLLQTGPLWVTERPFFDFSRVNPLNGFKRLFSAQGLIEFGRALLKLAVVGWVAYGFLQENANAVLSLSQMPLREGLALWAGLAYGLALRVGGAYLVLAAADYFYQRWNLMRSLKMTKEEIKEELRNQEGDPLLKGRIRGEQRRFARQRMLSKVPQADVVITNPTHFAVALQYDRDRMRAPQVVAKGAALVAQRIREAARAAGVPIVENPPLARSLFRLAELDQEIPPELYLAVAEVLAFVYRLKTQRLPAAPAAPLAAER